MIIDASLKYPNEILNGVCPIEDKELFQNYNISMWKNRLESIEDIEILRFLELGFDVRMIVLSSDSIAVDTLEDVEHVEKIYTN